MSNSNKPQTFDNRNKLNSKRKDTTTKNIMGNQPSRPQGSPKEEVEFGTAEIEEALRIKNPLIVPRDGYGFEITPIEKKHLNIAPNHDKIKHYSTMEWGELMALVKANVTGAELLLELHRNLAESFYSHTYRRGLDCVPKDFDRQEARRELLSEYDWKWDVKRPAAPKTQPSHGQVTGNLSESRE